MIVRPVNDALDIFVCSTRYRSLIYKETLMAYLGNVKARGFHTAHIWSSAPAKDDNYIFNMHPSNQRIPDDIRLLQWYEGILTEAQARGIVGTTTNLFDEYWPADNDDKASDLRFLPYLGGDFWIDKAREIIQVINRHREDRE